jgi:AcrR family transcriptional regulator
VGTGSVTVYARFATGEALLEAVVERAVGHAAAALAGQAFDREWFRIVFLL